MKSDSLLIFGGSGVEYHNGKVCAKGAFSDYLEGLTDQFNQVTWITTDYKGNNFKIPLTTNVKVITGINKGLVSFSIFSVKKFLNNYKNHTYILIFLPFGVYLTPIIFFKKILNFSYVTYVGTNFRDHNVSKVKKFKSKTWKFLFRFAIKSSNHVIARGKFLRGLCADLNAQNSLTIPLSNRPPEEVDFMSAPNRFKQKQVIFIGIVKKSKGIQMLISALNSLGDLGVNLIIIGNGPDMEYMKSVATEANHLKIEFLGWLDRKEEISNLINHSSFLVCPSLEPFEGVPRVIDESIMHKVPVIATKVGGIDMEFTPDEIFKIDPTEEQLTDAVMEMLTNEKIYNKYVSGLENRYSWLVENPNAAAQHASIIKSSKN